MPTTPQRLILDVDTGFDDAVALLMAGHHPALELAAVCVTHGNAPLAVTLENTLRLLHAGQLARVPVYAGAERALIAPALRTDPMQHARFDLPAAPFGPQPPRAAEFLIDYYLGPHGPQTVYAPIGPQTNLALALRLEPRLAQRIPRIITMAGAYLEGNSTPSAEFNLLADPEAAHIVFTAGIPITMLGLEVCYQALVTPNDLERLRALNTPWARLAADLAAPHVQWWIEQMQWSGGPVYDACVPAALIAPEALKTRAAHVDIELTGQFTRGRTVADLIGWHTPAPNVQVGIEMDRPRFVELLCEALQ
jgi:inosine-uridine nucleoside N-ribohydrolase